MSLDGSKRPDPAGLAIQEWPEDVQYFGLGRLVGETQCGPIIEN